jgi:succinylglutamate desuccinylase
VTEVNRQIGQLVSETPGATLITVAAIHGNEQGGIAAAQRIVERLSRGDVAFKGEFLALAGNVGAIRAGKYTVTLLGERSSRAWPLEVR